MHWPCSVAETWVYLHWRRTSLFALAVFGLCRCSFSCVFDTVDHCINFLFGMLMIPCYFLGENTQQLLKRADFFFLCLFQPNFNLFSLGDQYICLNNTLNKSFFPHYSSKTASLLLLTQTCIHTVDTAIVAYVDWLKVGNLYICCGGQTFLDKFTCPFRVHSFFRKNEFSSSRFRQLLHNPDLDLGRADLISNMSRFRK